MQKEIEVNGKKFVVRELLAIDVDGIDFNNKIEAIKKQVVLSTSMTEEEYKNLTIKERLLIINEINAINGLSDFQQPAK